MHLCGKKTEDAPLCDGCQNSYAESASRQRLFLAELRTVGSSL